MKRRDHLGWLAGAAALAVAGRAGAAPVAPGAPVPWPEVRLLDGTPLRAEQIAGRAVVVVFWSTTCPYCRRHNQHVEKLHRAAAGQPLVILGAVRDRDAAQVRQHAQAHGYTFPMTLDARPLAEVLSRRNMVPLTVTIDRQGRLGQVIPGEMFESDVLELLKLAA